MNIKNGDVMVAEMDKTREKIRFVLKKEEKKKEKKTEAWLRDKVLIHNVLLSWFFGIVFYNK